MTSVPATLSSLIPSVPLSSPPLSSKRTQKSFQFNLKRYKERMSLGWLLVEEFFKPNQVGRVALSGPSLCGEDLRILKSLSSCGLVTVFDLHA